MIVSGSRPLGVASGATHVRGRHNATLSFDGTTFIGDDIFLDNAKGERFEGALQARGPTILNGITDLGDLGSSVSGETIDFVGAIAGAGSLHIVGDDTIVRISRSDNTFSGDLRIQQGRLGMRDGGAVTTASQVIVESGASLILDNLAQNSSDRIGDHIPVEMRGGEIIMSVSPEDETVNERFGPLAITSGRSLLAALVTSPNQVDAGLIFESIRRDRGSTVRFETADTRRVQLTEQPTLQNGIMGGWATTLHHVDSSTRPRSFATYAPDAGIQVLAEFERNVGQAGPGDNLLISANIGLDDNLTINSLHVESGETFDLGGNHVVLESGGLLVDGKITNGSVTSASGELFLYGDSPSSITDHGDLSVAVVISEDVHLDGIYSYTGGTFVNDAAVNLKEGDRLPEGNLSLTGSSLLIDRAEPIRGQNLLIRNSTLNLVDSGVEFDNIELQSGTISRGQLLGDGTLRKTTDGVATIRVDDSQFTGSIEVFDGFLKSTNGLDRTPITLYGGLFGNYNSHDGVTVAGPIFFEGGDLYLQNDTYTGDLTLGQPADVTTAGNEAEISGRLIGDASINFDGDFHSEATLHLSGDNSGYSGPMSVTGGTLLIRESHSLGPGELTVHSGGRVRLHQIETTTPIHLRGGEVIIDGDRDTGIWEMTAAGNSSLQTEPNGIVHHLTIQDGATLLVGSNRRLDIEQMSINGSARLLVQRTDAETHEEGEIFAGIVAGTDNAILDIRQSYVDRFDITSVEVPQLTSLSVLNDGQQTVVEISSAKSLIGGGTLKNDVVVDSGGSIQSTGPLSIDGDVTFRDGARFVRTASDLAIESSLSISGFATVEGDAERAVTVELQSMGEQTWPFHPNVDHSWTVMRAASLEAELSDFAIDTDMFRPSVDEDAFRLALGDDDSLTLSYRNENPTADFDVDGDVDAADLTRMVSNWTGALPLGEGIASFFDGDFDGDGDIDSADQTAFVTLWTGALPASSIGPVGAAVPEPIAGRILLCSLLLVGCCLRRRISRIQVVSAGRCHLFLLILTLAMATTVGTVAVADDGTWIQSGSGSWNDPDNWLGGVPQVEGDVATFLPNAPSSSARITVQSPISLGGLESSSARALTVQGGEILFDDRDASSHVVVSGARLLLSSPIRVQEDESLTFDVGSTLDLLSEFSASGTVSVVGNGRVTVRGNLDFTGNFEFQAGRTTLTSAGGITEDASLAIFEGAEVNLDAVGDEAIVVPMQIHGGLLSIDATESRTISSPFELFHETSRVDLPGDSRTQLTGPISGTGGLSLGGQLGTIEIRGNNTYAGRTTFDLGHAQFGEGGWAEVFGTSRLGDTLNGTDILGGTVTFHEGTDESFVVHERGKFAPTPSEVAYSGQITLRGGVLHPIWSSHSEQNDTVKITGRVVLEGSGLMGDSPFIGTAAELSGGISGPGVLLLEGNNSTVIDFTGPVEHIGDVVALQRSNALFSGRFAPAGDLYVTGGDSDGRVRFSGDLSDYHNDLVVGGAAVFLDTDATLRRVRIDSSLPVGGRRSSNALLQVGEGASLTILEDLQFHGGYLSGHVLGVDEIVKVSQQLATLGPMPEFAGDIRVAAGALSADHELSLGSPDAPTHVARRNAILIVREDVIVEEQIILDDSTGYQFVGGLVGNGEVAGNVFLGEKGSYIGGRGATGLVSGAVGGDLTISGSIHGGTLYKAGSSTALKLSGAGHTYTGETHVLGAHSN